MNTTKKLLFNGFTGGFSQIIVIVLKFVTRTFLIKYVGIEILGISGTIASLISTLSLAELGFQGAIVYRLYKPLAEKDFDTCNELICIYRRVYEITALVIAVLMFLFVPFLRFLMKGVEVTAFIFFLYIISGINTIVSYLLAYKRSLLYVDQKDSFSKIVDSICVIFFTTIGIFTIYKTRNYSFYLSVQVLQTVISNLIIHKICNNFYKWQKKLPFNKDLFKKIFFDVKNIFANRIAIYIYTATDNLVISSFVGTAMVGYYSNYLLITGAIKGIVNAALTQMTPFLGRKFVLSSDKCVQEQILMLYTFIRFLIAGGVIVPLIVLTDSFISWWLGNDFILKSILLLLCVEMYIDFVHSALCDYISISGSFLYEKYISIIGAVCNIVSSILFVQRFGVSGVLYGTILSQLIFWFLRCICVLKKIFNSSKKFYFSYIAKNILYVLIVFVTSVIAITFLNKFKLRIYFIEFLCKGFVSVAFFCLFSLVVVWPSKEFKIIYKKFLNK